MSLWHCPEHGLVGPGPCCQKAGLAQFQMPADRTGPREMCSLDICAGLAAHEIVRYFANDAEVKS
jgi:hypothetical protein